MWNNLGQRDKPLAVAFCQIIITTVQSVLQRWLFSNGTGIGYVMSVAILFPVAWVSILSATTVLWRGAPFFNDNALHDLISIVASIIMVASYAATLYVELEVKRRKRLIPLSQGAPYDV